MSEQAIDFSSRSLVRRHQSSARWLQILLDQSAVALMLMLHTYLKMDDYPAIYRLLTVTTILLMAIVYTSYGVYQQKPLFDRILNLLRAWVSVIILLVALGFVTKTSASFSREVILLWSITAFFAQVGCYFFVSYLQTISQANQKQPTLLIGARPLGHHLVSHINRNKWLADEFVGVLEDNEQLGAAWDIDSVPVLGQLEDVQRIVRQHGIRRVYIALPLSESHLVKPLYLGLSDLNLDVIWAPDIFGVNLLNHSIHEAAGVPLISLSETPMIGASAFIKQIMDVVIAGSALVALSPLMLVIAGLVKRSSPGPVLFKQARHGWDGKEIEVWKFRSMRLHDEEDGTVTQARRGDDRITPIGRFIRKTSIDELPQLINVLQGHMSIVGPRPHAVAHNDYYTSRIRAYMTRHRVKPGLTGLAQVNGFRGETSELEHMEDRVQYDLAYINNWTPWLDLKIMLRTAFVLVGKDVY